MGAVALVIPGAIRGVQVSLCDKKGNVHEGQVSYPVAQDQSYRLHNELPAGEPRH